MRSEKGSHRLRPAPFRCKTFRKVLSSKFSRKVNDTWVISQPLFIIIKMDYFAGSSCWCENVGGCAASGQM